MSETALFLCQRLSSIMSHLMTNSMWVRLLYLFARQSHQSCLIPQPIASEWDCLIYLPDSLINHVSSHGQQYVSETPLFIGQTLSSIMSYPMTNSKWVRLLYLFARHSHQSCFISWQTGSEWGCFISLPGLINHASTHDQQGVSETALFLCQAF